MRNLHARIRLQRSFEKKDVLTTSHGSGLALSHSTWYSSAISMDRWTMDLPGFAIKADPECWIATLSTCTDHCQLVRPQIAISLKPLTNLNNESPWRYVQRIQICRTCCIMWIGNILNPKTSENHSAFCAVKVQLRFWCRRGWKGYLVIKSWYRVAFPKIFFENSDATCAFWCYSGSFQAFIFCARMKRRGPHQSRRQNSFGLNWNYD